MKAKLAQSFRSLMLICGLCASGAHADAVTFSNRIFQPLHGNDTEQNTPAIEQALKAASALEDQKKYAEAEKAYREIRAKCLLLLGPHRWATITSQQKLGQVLAWHRGRTTEAVKYYQEALSGVRYLNRGVVFDLRFLRNSYASVLIALKRYDEALHLKREWVARLERSLGPAHEYTIDARLEVASSLESMGRCAAALEECRAAIAMHQWFVIFRHLFHPDERGKQYSVRDDHSWGRGVLAVILKHMGKNEEAVEVYRTILAEKERAYPWDHITVALSRHHLAFALYVTNKYEEAERLFRAALKGNEQWHGADHRCTLACRLNLAAVLEDQGKHAEADQEYRAVLKAREGQPGPRLFSQANYDAEQKELRSLIKIGERVLGDKHPDVLQDWGKLAKSLEGQDKMAEALPVMKHAAELATSALGSGHATAKQYQRDAKRIEAALKK